ncbi:hypothetical protein H7985_24795, partial [Escherichia coli]|uniref:hypothetical protein n=1 Tax=Escherichia coli TaxID=562 RepID=UPI001D02F5EE
SRARQGVSALMALKPETATRLRNGEREEVAINSLRPGDVIEVTEQVAESEKAQPEAEVVAQPELVAEETPEPVAIEREELPL